MTAFFHLLLPALLLLACPMANLLGQERIFFLKVNPVNAVLKDGGAAAELRFQGKNGRGRFGLEAEIARVFPEWYLPDYTLLREALGAAAGTQGWHGGLYLTTPRDRARPWRSVGANYMKIGAFYRQTRLPRPSPALRDRMILAETRKVGGVRFTWHKYREPGRAFGMEEFIGVSLRGRFQDASTLFEETGEIRQSSLDFLVYPMLHFGFRLTFGFRRYAPLPKAGD